jgi:hypothetical protein
LNPITQSVVSDLAFLWERSCHLTRSEFLHIILLSSIAFYMKKILFFLALICMPPLLYAQAVGIGTTTPNSTTVLHADAGSSTTKGFLFSGIYNAAATIPDLGIGSRLMFYPGKAAFRAGAITTANSTEYWNNINVGGGVCWFGCQ